MAILIALSIGGFWWLNHCFRKRRVEGVEEKREKKDLQQIEPPELVVAESALFQNAIEGWVFQVGPTCASASVAGVLNTVCGQRADYPDSFCLWDVHRAYLVLFSLKREEHVKKLVKVLPVLGKKDADALSSVFTQRVCKAAKAKKRHDFSKLLESEIQADGLGMSDAARDAGEARLNRSI